MISGDVFHSAPLTEDRTIVGVQVDKGVADDSRLDRESVGVVHGYSCGILEVDALERIESDVRERRREIDRCQTGTSAEGHAVDVSHPVRQVQDGESRAPAECGRVYRLQSGRQCHGSQVGGPRERA